ncbi:right-handed parallel beta-helix repeat-containing protein [Rossellomorea marisflavi]|uniref:right-handed parallel beta-helix repeat-containing protein n=1 Tax=Rossellomorea marisflavi TaxID=189381 RepID=UPI003D2F1577
MKLVIYPVLLIFFLVSAHHAAAEQPSIQSLIDAAESGSVLKIPPGTYDQPIVVDKPLTLLGEGKVLLNSCLDSPNISITSNGVTLSKVAVEQCPEGKGSPPAIYVTGKGHMLEDLEVTAAHIGIKVDEASDITIEGGKVTGKGKENGIDLWATKNSTITSVTIKEVRDGVYMERSNGNHVVDNSMENARYGVHLMFSDSGIIEKNVSQNNFTGAMVMESDHTRIFDNEFKRNNQNVHSQGLLLYTTKDTLIHDNLFESNRVGAFIEDSQEAVVENNRFQTNMVSVQFKKAEGNRIQANDFYGNVNNAHAIESSGNELNQNYWDDSMHLDLEGQGISAIPYSADPYFLTLVNEIPEYQLFFQNPGLSLIREVFASPEDAVLRDPEPLMTAAMPMEASSDKQKNVPLWIMGIIMSMVPLITLLKWRKTK